MNLEIAKSAIESLALELSKNGKGDVAKYFLSSLDKLNQGSDIKETLRQLQRSGMITQYANFSSIEDELWKKVHFEVTNCLEAE